MREIEGVARRITARQMEEFAASLRCREYSQGTVENYLRAVRQFAEWNGTAPLTRDRTAAWKAHLRETRAPATVNAMIAGVNRFLAHQGWEDCRVRPLRLQRRSFLVPDRTLSREGYRALVRAARSAGRERLALVMETMCATGIRVSEVRCITVEAARRGQTEISLKGKIRTILLPGTLCRRLLKYARANRIASGPLFRTRQGHPLSRTQIWAEMKRLCPAAGVSPTQVFPHNLRRLFARCFYQASRDVVKLADLLGHSSINTTRIYLLTTGAEHMRQLERLKLLC